MAIVILYETGNSYYCSCCRVVDNDYIEVEDPEEAIKKCIEIAKDAEWDFNIKKIIGDNNKLADKIEKAILLAEEKSEIKKKIKNVENHISSFQGWT